MDTILNNLIRAIFVLGLALALGGCANKIDDTAPVTIIDQKIYDPLEPANRVSWDLNYKVFDKYLLRPVAVFYRNYIPDPLKSGIYNVTSNLNEPSAMVNNLLQGNVADAGNALGRLLINSTLGILGVFDVASQIGLDAKHDEFGEVLAVYGVHAGPYLMVPAMGPTTVRNEVGDVVDDLYIPGTLIGFLPGLGIKLIKGIHQRAQLLEQEAVLKSSLDPYIFVREAYYQYRTNDIYDGNVPEIEEEDEDFGDDFDLD